VEGFQEGGLAALVLADEAGHVRLEPDDPRILDAPEFLNQYRFQDHVPLRVVAGENLERFPGPCQSPVGHRFAADARVHLRREAAKDCA
jgi:hypothetical protein